MRLTTGIFKALADETRLRIMLLLLDNDELCVCDLTTVLELPQSTVSRHLAHLRNAGLVTDQRRGVWTYYRAAARNGLLAALFAAMRRHAATVDVARKDRRRHADHARQKEADSCR